MSKKLADVKNEADIVSVIQQYGIDLHPRGVEMVGLCPFHADTRPSLKVNVKKQVFYCPVCQHAAGDVFDFVMLKEGCTITEARDKIAGAVFEKHVQPPANVMKQGQPTDWLQVTPAPQPGQIIHHKHGKPSQVWEYLNAAGERLGYICRFDTAEGKEILPYTYREAADSDRRVWMFRAFDQPRPLYNLQGLAKHPRATVVLVEGEKTADAAQRLLPKCVVCCWQGGANALKVTDWTPLAGRKIIGWPDNDAPGLEAMQALSLHLAGKSISPDMTVVIPPSGKVKGWDLFDAEAEGWTQEETKAWALGNFKKPDDQEITLTLSNMYYRHGETLQAAGELEKAVVQFTKSHTLNPLREDAPARLAEIETLQKPPVAAAEIITHPPLSVSQIAAVPAETGGNNRHFEVLGFVKNDGKQAFAFYIKSAKMVVLYPAAGLASKTNLITLAPMYYWEDMYPTGKRGGGFSVEQAVEELVGHANRRGVFTTRMMRGRGAWYDEGRTVLHLGTHLVVNGVEMELGQLRTRFVYEAGENMEMSVNNPLDNPAAVRLMEVTRLMNWEREISAYLLAGWCVIAPFCGALKWRPHIWISGGAGTGKTWIFREVVRRLLGGSCLAVQSETSEAGLRQMLASDAIPVVFDEAEGETRHALERMEHVLALMRASSSSDGGIVAKGTSTGRGQTFEVRSCFACASINSPITLQADRTRVTPLALKEPSAEVRAERWEKLQQVYSEVITADFIAGLQARTLRLLPTILHNADVFAAAATVLLGQQRIGDQLGAMLAGAYSLHRTGQVDYKAAMDFIQGKDWQEERLLQDTKDELHLLATMAEKMIRVDGLEGAPAERNLGELVRIAAGMEVDTRIVTTAAQERLKRLGFKVDGQFLLISNNSDQMRAWMQGTAWAKNYHKTLSRLEGAGVAANVRFASGVQARATKLPLTFFQ